jgi:hypothetical protein
VAGGGGVVGAHDRRRRGRQGAGPVDERVGELARGGEAVLLPRLERDQDRVADALRDLGVVGRGMKRLLGLLAHGELGE